MEMLNEDYYNGSQSVQYQGVFKMDEYKLMIELDVDAIRRQSSAVISIFNKQDLDWNHLDSIHYSKMDSAEEVFAYRKVEQLKYKEIEALKRKAKQILL
mgnify:CR=1 FL=1